MLLRVNGKMTTKFIETIFIPYFNARVIFYSYEHKASKSTPKHYFFQIKHVFIWVILSKMSLFSSDLVFFFLGVGVFLMTIAYW